MFLLVLGALTALGIWFGMAGPAGGKMRVAAGLVFGLVRGLVPLGLVIGGWSLLWGGRTATRSSEDDEEPDLAPLLVGGVLLLVSACGLFHLGRGRPSLDAPTEAFVDAGGHLGWAVGTPLHAALGPYGSGLLLLAVGMLGLVVLLHTHVSTIGSALGIVLRRGGRTILHSWQVVVGEGRAPSG
ncbi:MAG: DNA translocase FtsK 4TM domain-containing protein, partial [Acidimicrobiales bacterium]|nr:DNA translocase FtsK 4TM domain-containing protein [Acidimicrobiales bacterium]